MKFKKQISLLLAAVMTFGSANLAFADTDTIIEDQNIYVSSDNSKSDENNAFSVSRTTIAYRGDQIGTASSRQVDIENKSIYLKFQPYDEITTGSSLILNIENGKFRKKAEDDYDGSLMKWKNQFGDSYIDVATEYAEFSNADGSISTEALKRILRSYMMVQTNELPYIMEYLNEKQIKVTLYPIAKELCNTKEEISVDEPYYNIPIIAEVTSAMDYNNVYINVESSSPNIPSGYRALIAYTPQYFRTEQGRFFTLNNRFGAADSRDVLEGNIIIPSIVNGINVKEISAHALSEYKNIESVIIPSGVETIGSEAFARSGIKALTIPKTVNKMYLDSISDCSKLTDIYYEGDENAWNAINKVSLNTYDQDALEHVTIHYNSNIQHDEPIVYMPEFVRIDGYRFEYYDFDNSINCDDGISGKLTIPAEIDGKPIKRIGSYGLRRGDLTEAVLSEGIESLGAGAFMYDIKSITIPKSVKKIDEGFFYDFSSDVDIYYNGSEAQWNKIDIGDKDSFECSQNTDFSKYFNIHYKNIPDGSSSTTETTTESTTLTETTTESTTLTTESTTEPTTESTTEPTTEPDYVLSGSSIVVPVEGGNIYINKDSGEVSGCDEGVISVDIPSKANGVEVKSISADAFKNCKDLKSITIPDTVTAIAENAFADCISLIEIHCTKGSFADNKALYPENTEIKYTEALLYGDADGDGSLIASDAAAVLQKVLKSTYKLPIEDLTPDYEKYLDVDGSGKLDAADAAMILQKVLKSTYKFSIEQ